jgi:hypothetical protein
MVDISFIYNETVTSAIEALATARQSQRRHYLGMSEIGDECSRKLWLKYHLQIPQEFPGRVLRMFDLGNLIEDRIIMELNECGFTVTGQQASFTDFDGAFCGHCDGIISELIESDVPHILEIKSASDASFKQFKKDGIEAHPAFGAKYAAQVQCYMGYSGLKRALFIVENKNTSEMYPERVRFDRSAFDAIRKKAERILTGKIPEGISSRLDHWQCKMCSFNSETICKKTYPGESPF